MAQGAERHRFPVMFERTVFGYGSFGRAALAGS